MVAIGLVFIGMFVLWERHRTRVRRSQILDLGLFRHPTFVWGNVTAGAVAVGEFGLVFVLPLYLVNVLPLGVNSAPADSFAAATQWSVLAAGAFLLLGFVGALRVAAVVERSPGSLAPEGAPGRAS